MILIGITGPARAGKDTAADYLARRLGLHKVAFADPIKKMLKVGLGLTDEQLDGAGKELPDPIYGKTPREMMQTLGTEWGRELIHPDLWMLAMERHLVSAYRDCPHHIGYIIPGIRFENEADFIRANGRLLHIVRDQRSAIDNPSHVSESGIALEFDDALITNNGTIEQLHEALECLLPGLAPASTTWLPERTTTLWTG